MSDDRRSCTAIVYSSILSCVHIFMFHTYGHLDLKQCRVSNLNPWSYQILYISALFILNSIKLLFGLLSVSSSHGPIQQQRQRIAPFLWTRLFRPIHANYIWSGKFRFSFFFPSFPLSFLSFFPSCRRPSILFHLVEWLYEYLCLNRCRNANYYLYNT